MRYLSVCSGIEAASVAWHPLGWHTAAVSEIEPFPSAVLSHRFPEVPNLGDFTRIIRSPTLQQDVGDVSVIVGGTPCQSFSISGLRGGLSDERGNLALEFMRLIGVFRPRWILWENVPGVLSSNGGRDFGTIIGALANLRYGFAWRVLDAQFFGVAQRRRRVFIVGHSSGRAECAAQVLFERESMRRDSETRNQTGKDAASGAGRSAKGYGGKIGTLMARYGSYRPAEVEAGLYIPSRWPAKVAPTLAADYGSKMGLNDQHAFGGAGLFVPAKSPTVTSKWAKGSGGPAGDETNNLVCQPIAYDIHGVPATSGATETSVHVPLRARPPGQSEASTTTVVSYRAGVRRLTPTECERLQGFPDDWTNVPWRGGMSSDGPRYKAIGNSMAVPVMRWIGERIKLVDEQQSAT